MLLLHLTLAAALWYTATSILAWYRLRQFRGPFLAKFSYLWELKAARTGRAVQIYAEALQRYGQLARIAPDVLLTDEPDAIRQMSAARSTYRRSEWYSSFRLDPYQHSMFSSSDTAFHDKIKSKTASAYAGRDVPGLEADIDKVIGRLHALIRRKYMSDGFGPVKRMDFSKVAQWFTLDSLGGIAFGMDFGHLETDSDVYSVLKTSQAIAPYVQLCAELPFLRKIVFSDFVIKLLGPKPTDAEGIGRLQGLAKEVVSKQFDSDRVDDKPDMLSSFARHGLTKSECENEALLLIIAGSDTTATIMRTTMLYLMSNVVAYKKLQAEIDLGIKEGRISTPVTSAEGKELPYLQAVIAEGMRIHPSASSSFMKTVPPEGDVLCGQRVPGGTHIAHCMWSTFRRKDIFGDDVEVFRPERWLEAESAKKSLMSKTLDLHFGYGRWSCAGKQIGYLELNKVFVELLRYFDFQIADPARPWNADNYILFYITDMWVTVTERKQT